MSEQQTLSDLSLQERVSRLERIVGIKEGDDASTSPFDHMDRTVLAVLESKDPDIVRTTDLQTLYQRHTKIRRKQTLRKRIKRLTKEGPFENTGTNRWTYDP